MAEILPDLTLSAEFHDFIRSSGREGYGGDDLEIGRAETGEFLATYSRDNWMSHDQWDPGVPSNGKRTISVSHPERPDLWMPIWSEVYRTEILDPNFSTDSLKKVLKIVLAQPDQALPIRGPVDLEIPELGVLYTLRHTGTLEEFEAHERCTGRDGRILSETELIGGLVNRRTKFAGNTAAWFAEG